MSHTRLGPIVSLGNRKIGAIPNISLLPIRTCPKAGCATCRQCYALKALRMYPAARQAWAHNTRLAADPKAFWNGMDAWLEAHRPPWMRLHVSGDCPTRQYVTAMLVTVRRHPGTRFLLFTKRYSWFVGRSIPSNLSVVFSAWPGFKMPKGHGFRVAWMRDERNVDKRIPGNAIDCPGSCENCMLCWHLASIGRDVCFDKH